MPDDKRITEVPSNEEDVEFEVITVVDEEGEEHEFELFHIFEVEGNRYAVLFPLDEEEDSDDEEEAIILRVEEDEDGEDTLSDIEDEEEWNKVLAAWEAIFSAFEDPKN